MPTVKSRLKSIYGRCKATVEVVKCRVLVDRALSAFATKEMCPSSGPCNVPVYQVEITECGQVFVDKLALLIYGIIASLSDLVSAVGAR